MARLLSLSHHEEPELLDVANAYLAIRVILLVALGPEVVVAAEEIVVIVAAAVLLAAAAAAAELAVGVFVDGLERVEDRLVAPEELLHADFDEGASVGEALERPWIEISQYNK